MNIKAIPIYDLKPFMKKYTWLVRPVSVFFLLISPLYILIMSLIESKDEIVYFYEECLGALIYGVKEDK